MLGLKYFLTPVLFYGYNDKKVVECYGVTNIEI